jgi:ribosomal protein S18 acetylase RimI-like enzyme
MLIDKTKIRIRRVEDADIADMVRYRLAYLTEMQGQRDEMLIEKLEGELSDYFHANISNGCFIALVAEVDGIILGYGGMVLKQIPGDLNKSSYTEGDILNMYTIPGFRRQGISTLILTELLAIAGSAGLTKVALHTSKDGEILYRNFGFREPVYPYLEKVL